MTRQYFGTDGIRGKANHGVMTAELAQKVAMASALALKTHKTHSRVIIGKDTRLSCYMLEQAMASGFLAMGMEVLFLGPIPTPAVSMLTRSMRADLGVMISASHNPYYDNGVKLFGADGYKLSDEKEEEIEKLLDTDLSSRLAEPEAIGRARRIEDASGRYVEFVKSTFPKDASLEGVKVVIDCAHGAAYKVAPQVLWELGATVIPIAVSPNGKNINQGCGATDTAILQDTVIREKADIGIALDGDADRLIVVDELGQRTDGDQIMALAAKSWKERGLLENYEIVATVMSNLGMERYLEKEGLNLFRTKVGDRYVMERMLEAGAHIGGEQSGHMIFSDFSTTGDGLLSALQVLSTFVQSNKKASKLLNVFEPVPQILKNMVFDPVKGSPLEDSSIQTVLSEAEERLKQENGRLLVRKSGTEPKIRVMAEGDNLDAIETIIDDIIKAMEMKMAA